MIKISAKIYFASVITAILILAPVSYFVLPLLYPNMKNDEGIIIQSVYEEFNAIAWIEDSVTTYELINQTELTVTTRGDTLLAILFTMQAVLSLDPNMAGALQFQISLVVDGVGNRTLMVAFYDIVVYGNYRELPVDITINYITESLTAGNYTIGVYWRTRFNLVGNNFLIANNPPNYNYFRTIWAQEMKI